MTRTDHTTPPDLPGSAMRGALLGWCARLVAGKPLLVIVVAAVLAIAGGIVAAVTLDLDADTNSLIADDRPFMKTYRAFIEEFGDLEYLYVVVDAGSPPDTEHATSAVHALVERLREQTDLPGVHGTITGTEQWRVASRAMALDQLQGLVDASDAFQPILANAPPSEILGIANARLNRLMSDGLGMGEAEATRLGAEALFMLEAIAAAPAWANTPPSDFTLASPRAPEYLVSSTGRMYFVEILPRKDFGSLAVIERPLAEIRTAINEVQADHPEITIGLTGKPVLQADELATTQVDMTRASIIALTIISLLFMIVFRGIRRPLLAVLAFAAAFGWTYGIAALLVGRLNLLSMVFMLVMVGVGLDYGVHTVARWNEARKRGDARSAIDAVMRTAAVGNMTGAVISAGVFLLALLTAFQGLRELGTIAGIGLLFCVLAMTIVLPALLYLTERTRGIQQHRDRVRAGWDGVTGRPLQLLLLLVATGTSVLFVFIVPERIDFESNLLELQAKGLESVEWEHRIFDDDASASWFAAIIVDSIEDIPPIIARAGDEPEIGRVLSVLDIIEEPSPERQELREALAKATVRPAELAQADPEIVEPSLLERVARNVRRLASHAEGRAPDEDVLRMRTIADRLLSQRDAIISNDFGVGAIGMQQRIDSALANTSHAIMQIGIGAAEPLRDALPSALRARFMSPEGRFLILLQPAEDVWEYEPMGSFVAAIRRVDPDATGVPITQYESMNDMARAFTIMAIGAVFVVGLLIWLDFRSLWAMILCMGSLGMGLLWTIGVLALGNIPINLANFFAIPILVGLSASGSIHVMHRWRQMQHSGESRYGATIRAVTLTACTTGIGFGALLFARHKGLESLGWVMAIGSLACLLTAVIVLPMVLEIAPEWLKRHLRGPATGS